MNPITYNHIMEAYTPEQWAEFAFFSANVQHILGEHDLQAQLGLYHRFLDYTEWQAGMSLCTGTAGACATALAQWIDQGAVLVTFHYGQYRLIPLSLLAMGYRVCILVSRDVYTDQVEYYRWHLPSEWFANLVFVIAEDSRLFFQISRYRRDGYILICYADGASGVKKAAQPSSGGIVEVGLGQATIGARSGFAAMAYLWRSPVAIVLGPVASMGLDWTLDSIRVYHPLHHRSRAHFVQQVLSGIYEELSLALAEYPECWECWGYLHQLMPVRTSGTLWDTEIRYMPLENEKGTFLLDKACYSMYPVDKIKFMRLKQAAVIAY